MTTDEDRVRFLVEGFPPMPNTEGTRVATIIPGLTKTQQAMYNLLEDGMCHAPREFIELRRGGIVDMEPREL